MEKKVSIIIPVFNALEFTKLCLEYLERNTPPFLYECLILNNGSTDGTAEFLNALPSKYRVFDMGSNLGFAKACNFGAKQAFCDQILFLNNDTVPQAGWLEPLVAEMDAPNVGAAGSLLFYPDYTVQHAGVVFDHSQTPYHVYTGLPLEAECVNQPRNFKAVTGACLLTRKSFFQEVGGFDERYLNCGEDTDFCLKLGERGWAVRYQPQSKLMHFESRSAGRRDSVLKARETFLASWHGKLEPDDLDYLVPDKMRLRVNDDASFTFIAEAEQEAEIGELKQRAWLYKSAQKTKEAFLVYKDIFMRYPYDLEVLQEMKMFCKLSGLQKEKELFEYLVNKLIFNTDYSLK